MLVECGESILLVSPFLHSLLRVLFGGGASELSDAERFWDLMVIVVVVAAATGGGGVLDAGERRRRQVGRLVCVLVVVEGTIQGRFSHAVGRECLSFTRDGYRFVLFVGMQLALLGEVPLT